MYTLQRNLRSTNFLMKIVLSGETWRHIQKTSHLLLTMILILKDCSAQHLLVQHSWSV